MCRFQRINVIQISSTFRNVCLLQIFYNADKLMFEMTEYSKRWTLSVSGIQADTWYFLELSWDVHRGLQVFVNHILRDELAYCDAEMISSRRGKTTNGRFLVGFADDADVNVAAVYGDFIVDEIELWFQDRYTLLAFGYVDRGLATTLHQ